MKNDLLHSHNISKEYETRGCLIDELKELCYMEIRPHIKEVINDLVMKLGQESLSMKKNGLMLDLPKPKWSEIVAGRRNKILEAYLP